MTVENETITPPVDTGPVVTADESADMGAVWDRIMTQNGSDRGEDGKFVSANAAPVAPADGGEGAGDDGVSSTVAPEPPAPVATAAPAHLPQSIKAEWESLSEPQRAAIVAHQTEMDRKFSEVGRSYQQVKPIAETLSQAMKQIPELAGKSVEQLAVGAVQLAAVQAKLQADPLGTLVQVAHEFGVLDKLKAHLSGQPAPEGSDQIASLHAEIRELKQALANKPENVQEIVARELQDRDTKTYVENFAKGKELYADVEASLPGFITVAWQRLGEAASQNTVMELAYEMAVNAIPEVRAKLRATEEKAAREADSKRTESAKNATSINVKSTMNGKERALTEQEALGSAYDRIMAS